MKYLFIVFISIILLLTEPVFAQSDNFFHSGGDINSYIPKALKNSFNKISNFQFNFSKIPFVRDISKYIPKSGKEAEKQIEKTNSFLNKINLFFEKNKIGRKISEILNSTFKIGLIILEKIVDLIKRGLNLLR